ncbi:MAG: BMP family ABC transporter substrate-binding protein [Clostridia bacterium]|nr:BMP family ABC transporter substrate-binding protein [Clostridia bacterium]
MKKLITLLLTAVMSVACCFGLAACGEKTGDKVAALICLHGTDSSYDKNFIDAFEAACKAKGLTSDQYTVVTGIPEEGDDCYQKAADFADAGYKAVFADSFGHEGNMIKAAKEFPDVQFCHATGTNTSLCLDEDATNDTPANFHNAFASIYEGRYLAGVAAGLKLVELYGDEDGNVTNENAKVGYVGAHPYAEVISGYTSWFLGVRSIVPNATMEVRYTYSWYSVNGEKASALALINNGCKLISGHADSMGVPAACKEQNIPNVFYNGTQPNEQFIIASKINWQPYFEMMIDSALNGTALPKDYTGTIASGSVQVTTLGPAAAEGTAAKLEEVKAAFAEGKKVFDCSTFTVNGAKADTSDFSKAEYITMDADGHLTAYLADVIDAGDFVGETNVIKTAGDVKYFAESDFRSAPYFDIIIDGISIGEDVAYTD